uniref:START domain-containing protein n=1 Tax=Timema shepardi TaxID=629360 RepID=A0A7R9B0Z0_TIMSH|nr:unnamed protein product [Timema shepardi]
MNELQCIYELLKRTVTCPTTNWVPFIEREDLLIWRKDCNALYAYKVYGNYNDVTAEDFLQVQIDTEYRKQWDNTAVNLQILESDPKTTSDIVYWEMQWPLNLSCDPGAGEVIDSKVADTRGQSGRQRTTRHEETTWTN